MPFPLITEELRRKLDGMRRPAEEELKAFVMDIVPRLLGTTSESFAERYHTSLRDRAIKIHCDLLEALGVVSEVLEKDGDVSAAAVRSAVAIKCEAGWGLYMLDKDNGELAYLAATPREVAH